MLSKAELARRVGIDRATVHRWETGQFRPDSAEVVQSFAKVLGLDLDEALAAAGLRPDVEPPTEPTIERDEEVELILSAPVSERMKKEMLDRLFELREQDKDRRVSEIQWWIKRARGA